MRAIPTLWNGVQFRSRLEAKWASFFARIGWGWDYEPIDLGGYIPDFFVGIDGRRDLLVEVKPFLRLDDDTIGAAHEKILESGYQGLALIVGARIGWDVSCTDVVGIGFLADTKDGSSDDSAFICPCTEGRHMALCVVQGLWYCRMCGGGHKVYHGASLQSRLQILSAWNSASNDVQWRGVRP